MNEKTASVKWTGRGKAGQGLISTETGALQDVAYGFASRFEDDKSASNPEEILGAAHAACFTMAEGFQIDRISLKLQAKVPGLDEAKFQEIANAAKENCPLSKALASVPKIELEAMLWV
jgi:osmotically inducible protein OsmC